MIRNLKALGFAAVVSVAIGAVVATAASAETLRFYAEAMPASLKGGSAEDQLTTTLGKAQCKEAGYTGALGEVGATTVELTPTYSTCTAFGFPAEVSTNGCKYRLRGGKIEGANREGTVDIVCPAGKEITVVAKAAGTTKCTLSVPAQSGLGTVTYTNVEGSSLEITAKLSLEKIEYTHVAGTGLGKCPSGAASNGVYAGTATIEGETEAEASNGVAVLVEKALFRINPEVMDFNEGGKGAQIPFLIENKSQTEPKINFIHVIEQFYAFKASCNGVTLKKEGVVGADCVEEAFCVTPKKETDILIAATGSYAIDVAILKNC